MSERFGVGWFHPTPTRLEGAPTGDRTFVGAVCSGGAAATAGGVAKEDPVGATGGPMVPADLVCTHARHPANDRPRPASRERPPAADIPRTTARGRHVRAPMPEPGIRAWQPANDSPRPARPSPAFVPVMRASELLARSPRRLSQLVRNGPEFHERSLPPYVCSVHRSEWGQAPMLLTAVPAMPLVCNAARPPPT